MATPLEAPDSRRRERRASVTMQALQTLRRPADAVVSPDGERVACSVHLAPCTDPPDGAQARIYIVQPGAGVRRITHGPGLDACPRWSPDGQQLAFASDRHHCGLLSLYLLGSDLGEAVPIGSVTGSVEQISWSADGRRLLVLAADPGSDRAGALTATRIGGNDGAEQDPKVIRPRQAWRRLLLVDIDDGTTLEAGPKGLNIWEFDWDGAGTAVAVASPDPSEAAWYDATLVVIDLVRREVIADYKPRRQLSAPCFSPDGCRVAFIEGLASDRATLAGGAPFCAQLTAGTIRPRTITDEIEVNWLSWRDNQSLFYSAWKGLGSACGTLCVSGAVTELWSGGATIGTRGAAGFTHDLAGKRMATVRQSTSEPPEVVLLALEEQAAGLQPLTDFNASLRELELPTWQERRWTAADGLPIEGLLALPPGRAPRELPLVVIVHGGPVSAWTHQWTNFGYPLCWTAAGYAVFMPNPRGSRGFGPAFAEAIVGDMGGAELGDILSGIDALVSAGIVDNGRVGILGKSHGGFMTSWAITQTDRFAAAIPVACVSDWLSLHYTTNIGRFDELFFGGKPFDAGCAQFQRSPVMHVGNICTPTLVVHGEIDLCTPVGQAVELYQGIVESGRAEVELVVYPREGHEILERAHQLDFWQRARVFFDRHLGTGKAGAGECQS
jgi:dipeptidyl aminopeptidase/acylaminoacyl peptidase